MDNNTVNKLKPATHEKLQLLQKWFKKRKGSIVAFSGGIDSTLVLYLARKYQGRENAIGVISNSESLKKRDFTLAKNFCEQFDIQLEIIKTQELDDNRYKQNPINRCFFCKEYLFKDIGLVAQKYAGFDVLSGANYDDLGDYRPGMDAANKYNVFSPMVECKVSKDQLREIARYFGLPSWNKPSSPCLSSRIPYNHEITAEKLRQIELAEDILYDAGFSDVRVRHYGDVAKIEVKNNELEKLKAMRELVVSKISNLGFSTVEIDDEGLVSGKLNRVIANPESK